MKKILCILPIIFLVVGCSDKKSNDTSTGTTLFKMNEKRFKAVLETANYGDIAVSNGSTHWKRTGSLAFIVSSLYNKPVKIRSRFHDNDSYNLTIKWMVNTPFDSIRNKVINKLKNTIEYTVEPKNTGGLSSGWAYTFTAPPQPDGDSDFQIVLESTNRTGKGSASSTNYWKKVGPLSYILTELYNYPIKINNSSHVTDRYILSITWDAHTSFKHIRNKAIRRLNNETKYTIEPKTIIKQQKYIFSKDGENNYTAVFRNMGYADSLITEEMIDWQMTGPLFFILSKLYGEPVEFESEIDPSVSYTFKIDLGANTSFEEIQNEVAQRLKNRLGYTTKYETREEPKYILSANNISLLTKITKASKYVTTLTTISSVHSRNEKYKIYSSLKRLANTISSTTNQIVTMEKDYGPKPYYFELTFSNDFNELLNQLKTQYDFSIRKEMIPVDHYIIKFK